MLLYRGREQSIRAWARELGLSEGTIRSRLKKGWNVALSLSKKPVYTAKVRFRH